MNKPDQIDAFGLSVKILWQAIPTDIKTACHRSCNDQHFYLSINNVANYLVVPKQNTIIIETLESNISFDIIATWLLGTVFAYLLQYHGYLVLHGSAVIINNSAVIFSGDSGAGKSTLAAAMIDKGYAFLTDDVVAIKKHDTSKKLVIIPGPLRVKLWEDVISKLNISTDGLKKILYKENKFEVPIKLESALQPIEVSDFYELNPSSDISDIACQDVNGVDKMQALIKNTYRYNMLKPLGKLEQHLNDCSLLAKQIKIKKITRPKKQYLLNELIELIEKDLLKGRK